MKTLKRLAFISALALGSLTMNAQQSSMYTHYMNNTLVVNPGYAGSRDALTVTGLHRSQWVGFQGSPITQTLTLHAPLHNEHIGVGLSIMNDNIGPTNTTSLFADFAYIMNLSKKSKLAFGLSAGANIFQAQLSSVELDVQNDPVFQNNLNSRTTPNFGVGAYYYTETFYAGVSAPYLIQNNYAVINLDTGSPLISKEQRHYFLIAGTVLKITDNLAFKPTTLIKLTPAVPIQADITASFIIMKRLLIGGMFRTGDALGVLLGFNVSDQLHIGYSFDWSYGLKTPKYNQGSHELLVRYDFLSFDKKQIHSPRNF